jgi:ankyrin repeat protein
VARRKPKRLKVYLGIAIPLAIVGVCGAFVYRAVVREQLRGPLMDAIRGRDPLEVSKLLARGADPNARAKPPITGGWIEVLKSLFRKQPKDDEETYSTALMIACETNKPAVAEMLIKAGADVNARRLDGWTSLAFAARNTPSDLVVLLLKHGAKVNVSIRDDGITPLMLASGEGDTASVQLLLDRKADARAVDKDGRQAIYFAGCKNRTVLYETLLAHGADVNTVIDAESNNSNVHGTLLINAVKLRRPETVDLLLNHDADTKPMDTSEDTALSAAVKPLIQEPNPYDGRELTEKETQVMARNYLQILRSLLDHGADPNVKLGEEPSLLFQSVDAGKADVAEALLTARANAEYKYRGQTPLTEAVILRDVAMVRTLLNHRINLNVRDSTGATPLMIALFNGDRDIATMLRKHGADTTLRDLEGRTVEQYAVASGKAFR